jgi:acetyl-CoA carboxylase carboxyl transferase subunit beta
MAWFKREKKPLENPTPVEERRVRTEGMWTKCSSCRAIIWKKDLESNWNVCPKCDHHSRLGARRRFELLLDDEQYLEFDADLASNDPLHFSDTKAYSQRLKDAQHKLGMKDAVLTAEGSIDGRPVTCCSMEFGFIGGSMGAVVGEKVARAIERSIERKQPLVIVSCSGGARMMEGVVSLMQLAKVSAALARLDDARIPYISILTDPTTGGVTASYAMLGDLNIAEPGALIGFAGPRVIEATIREKLPEGFQTAEFLLDHGFLDAIVPRKELKPYVSQALTFFLDS